MQTRYHRTSVSQRYALVSARILDHEQATRCQMQSIVALQESGEGNKKEMLPQEGDSKEPLPRVPFCRTQVGRYSPSRVRGYRGQVGCWNHQFAIVVAFSCELCH